jgi:hypothetical protein
MSFSKTKVVEAYTLLNEAVTNESRQEADAYLNSFMVDRSQAELSTGLGSLQGAYV